MTSSSDGPLFLAALPGVWEEAFGDAHPADDRDAADGVAPAATGLSRPAAILGVPLDRTTTYRSGTAGGPAEIRTASWSLETYSPVLGAELDPGTLYDFGDLALDRSRPIEDNLRQVEEATAGLDRRGFFPVVLGGEHLLTLGAYRGVAGGLGDGVPPPVFFHFDAHADLREEYEGLVLSHATVARHVAAAAGGRNVYQFGVRSGDRQEMLWGQANVNRIPGALAEATREALRQVAGRRVYCSLDIDIFDPSHAPGTGNPEPGGPPADDVFEAIATVGAAAGLGSKGGGIDLVAFDLVEVCPPVDPTGRTAVLAAKLVREFLIARGMRPGG